MENVDFFNVDIIYCVTREERRRTKGNNNRTCIERETWINSMLLHSLCTVILSCCFRSPSFLLVKLAHSHTAVNLLDDVQQKHKYKLMLTTRYIWISLMDCFLFSVYVYTSNHVLYATLRDYWLFNVSYHLNRFWYVRWCDVERERETLLESSSDKIHFKVTRFQSTVNM